MNGSLDEVTIRSEVLSSLGVFYRDLRSGTGIVNRNWIEMGYGYDEMARDRWLARIHPQDRGRVAEQFQAHVTGQTLEFNSTYRIQAANGEWRLLISRGVIARRDADGTPVVYVGHDTDITEISRLRDDLDSARQLAEERALEAEVLRAAGAVVVSSLDAPTAVRSVVEQLKLLVPFDGAVVCEADNRDIQFVGGSSAARENEWKAISDAHQEVILSTLRSKSPELLQSEKRHLLFMPLITRGSAVGVLILTRSGTSFSGEPVRIAMTMADYLALALSNARLYRRMQQRAEIDQLSGLLTRRAFMEAGEEIVDESFHAGRRITCLLLDLDHFKKINDTLGHLAGDEVIRRLGGILREALRGSDVIGRYGGEEFCALLPTTPVERGVEIADRVRAAVEGNDFQEIGWKVTVSIGVGGLDYSEAANGGQVERLSVEQLLKQADAALYQAKQRGRNRVVRHSSAR